MLRVGRCFAARLPSRCRRFQLRRFARYASTWYYYIAIILPPVLRHGHDESRRAFRLAKMMPPLRLPLLPLSPLLRREFYAARGRQILLRALLARENIITRCSSLLHAYSAYIIIDDAAPPYDAATTS